jgi:hypothetical protein
MSILSAASCGHPLQEIAAPLGALICRLRVLIVGSWRGPVGWRARLIEIEGARSEGKQSRNVRPRCQIEIEKFLT